jgi:hypothetical protein
MDGDNAMQALAEAIDDYIVGGPEVAVGALAANVGNTLEGTAVTRRGRTGFLRVNVILGVAQAAGAKLFTVPAGYAPEQHIRAEIIGGNSAPIRITYYASGDFHLEQASGAAQTLHGFFAYPLPRGALAQARPSPEPTEAEDE